MDKFEYKTESNRHKCMGIEAFGSPKEQVYLKEMGDMGWELVHVYFFDMCPYFYYWKRKIS